MNEIEAGQITGIDLSNAAADDPSPLIDAARAIHSGGIGNSVVIHCEAGAVAIDETGSPHLQGSVALDQDFIAGATGAGDAFAAGFLYGVHENLPSEDCLVHATCAAAACLSHPSTSGGMLPLAECLALGDRFGFRPFGP